MLLQHRDGGDTEEPGREPGNGFPPTLLGGNAPYPPGVSSALSHRPQLSPAAPGGGCSGLHPIPSAVLCSLAFLPRGRRQTGASPSAPLGPFCRPSPQPHPSWDFPLWWSGGEMGKIPSAVFPSSQQPQEQQVTEDAWTPRGCLAQSSFASNCTQALRFLPCRGAFWDAAPSPRAAAEMHHRTHGWQVEWKPKGPAAPDTRVLAQHLCTVLLPAPANLPCFAEPQGSIIAKPW